MSGVAPRLTRDWGNAIPICECCGSSLFHNGIDENHSTWNKGIVVWHSDKKINDDTDEYWTESIQLDEGQFLNIRHRNVSK